MTLGPAWGRPSGAQRQQGEGRGSRSVEGPPRPEGTPALPGRAERDRNPEEAERQCHSRGPEGGPEPGDGAAFTSACGSGRAGCWGESRPHRQTAGLSGKRWQKGTPWGGRGVGGRRRTWLRPG